MSAPTYIASAGAFVAALSAGALVYLNSGRETTQHAPQPKVELSCPAPIVNVPQGAPPVVNVAAAPALAPAPAYERARERAPARVAPARANKPETAKTTLRKRWSKPND